MGETSLSGRDLACAFFLIALGVGLFAPELIWGEAPRFGWAFEVAVAWALVALAARSPIRRLVRRVIIALYVVCLLLLTYQHAYKSFYRGEPAITEDVRLLVNLGHFVTEMASPRWGLIAILGLVAVALFVRTTDRALAWLADRARAASFRRVAALGAVVLVMGGASTAMRGPIRLASARLADNWRASVAVHRRLGALDEPGRDDRYDALMKVRLAKRPNVYFLVIEAYGSVLATWDMKESYRALMDRAGTALAGQGFHMRSTYSTAPVHGGRSWFSIATMQTGILIDQPDAFDAFVANADHVPSLVRFLKAQGYATASVEPGTKERAGVGSADPYAHDLRLDAPRLAYDGPRFGFGAIPDRYSLGELREKYLPTLPSPRYVFLMSVSTHYPWTAETVPTFAPNGPEWPELPGQASIGSDLRRHYLKAVEYDWRAILELLASDTSPDLVVVVVGDHQPRLESNAPGDLSFDCPLHVIARDQGFVERFGKRGFASGLYAEPGSAPPLTHEALYSMLVTELAGAYGTEETKGQARFYRDGISLRGLH